MAGTSESSSVAPFFFPVPHYKGRQPPDNMRGSPKDNSLLTAGRPTTPLSGSLRSALGLAPPGLGAISDNEATVVKTSRRKSPERMDNYLNTEEVISSFLYDMSVATDRSRVRWLDEQCKGLAEGLRGIHNTKLSSSHESGLQPPILDEKNCGRHGDIKPQNVLWFRQEKGAQGDHGVLKISDFGLTRFHSAITTKGSPIGLPVSDIFKAAEGGIPTAGKEQRAFDSAVGYAAIHGVKSSVLKSIRSTAVHYTISKDNTAGSQSRQAELLKSEGKKLQSHRSNTMACPESYNVSHTISTDNTAGLHAGEAESRNIPQLALISRHLKDFPERKLSSTIIRQRLAVGLDANERNSCPSCRSFFQSFESMVSHAIICPDAIHGRYWCINCHQWEASESGCL